MGKQTKLHRDFHGYLPRRLQEEISSKFVRDALEPRSFARTSLYTLKLPSLMVHLCASRIIRILPTILGIPVLVFEKFLRVVLFFMIVNEYSSVPENTEEFQPNELRGCTSNISYLQLTSLDSVKRKILFIHRITSFPHNSGLYFVLFIRKQLQLDIRVYGRVMGIFCRQIQTFNDAHY